MSSTIRKLTAKLPGLDWQTWLLKLGFLTLLVALIYSWGRGDGKEACQKEYVKEAKAQIKEIQMFVPVVDRQTQVSAEKNAKLDRKKEVYDEELGKRIRPAACDLNDNELRAFQELVEG